MIKINKISFILFFVTCFTSIPIITINAADNSLCLPPFEPLVDEQIYEIMNQNYIPSVATAVIRNNSIIWVKGYGEQPDPNIIYMTGSVAKTFTGTAIYQLHENGLIDLDNDVNDYLPFELRNPNYTQIPISIRMLLSHISGLSKDTESYMYGMAEDALQRLGWDNPYDWLPYPYWIEELLTPNGTLYDPTAWTNSPPGASRVYSNIGYNVLSYIILLVTGKPIWEYMEENIFDPLEMNNTGYNFSKFETSQLAIPHEYRFELDLESTGNKAYPHYNYLGYGSGAIRSNVYDLAKFLLVHMHEGISNGTRILENVSLNRMHQLQGPWIQPTEYWGGWGGTEGDIYGFHAKAYAYYDGNTTVPYGVVTILNQGMDEARDACFNITMLLANYIHKYDVLECEPAEGFTFFIIFTSLPLLVFFKRRKSSKTKRLDKQNSGRN
jgi:CubicO group peptidase (beta-lactamase class C family)